MSLQSKKNDLRFRNLLSIFCQTEIIFRLTIIFSPIKHEKNVEIIFHKLYCTETNRE
jgi:hypothetical protein